MLSNRMLMLPLAVQFISIVCIVASLATGPLMLSTATEPLPSLCQIDQLVEPVPVSTKPTITPWSAAPSGCVAAAVGITVALVNPNRNLLAVVVSTFARVWALHPNKRLPTPTPTVGDTKPAMLPATAPLVILDRTPSVLSNVFDTVPVPVNVWLVRIPPVLFAVVRVVPETGIHQPVL